MPEKLITEIKLIKRYSNHNEQADFRFRAFLKCLSIPHEELDQIVQDTTDDVWKQIDCLSCGNCCRTMGVVVDQNDIARLARHKGISEQEFSRRHVMVNEAWDEQVLKTSPCMFLGADNKCAIYEDRPTACRDFPYLHAPRFNSRTLMMITNCGSCPIVFNVWQRLKDRFWPKKRNMGGEERPRKGRNHGRR